MEQGFPWEDPRICKRVKPWVLDGFLTPYQRDAWAWLYGRGEDGSNLWWACGSGKTLAALLFLVSGPERERKVIVTRSPTKRQWQREAAQYTDMKLTILEGKTPTRIMPNVETVVLSWAVLKEWVPELKRWIGRRKAAIVWDEIHKGKAWRRKEKFVSASGRVAWRDMDNRAAAAAQLARATQRRLGLTATPIRDRRNDLWAQLDIIQPDKWGTNWDFVHEFCDARPGEYGGLDTKGTSNTTRLKSLIRHVSNVVSYGEMSKHLPPKRRQLVYLPASDQTRPASFKKEMKAAAARGKQALFETHLLVAASSKRTWIAETVRDAVEAGQKVTVFTGRRQDCEALTKLIKTKLKSCGAPVWSGHGGDSLATREDMVREYAKWSDGGCAFVGTTDAFGEAIDGLQHTDLAIFGLLPWTPGAVTQAEGRFSRHGSSRPVLIMYTVAEGTVDEHVADMLLEKLEGVETTLDDDEAGGVARTLSGMDDEETIVNSILEMFNE